MAFIYTIPWVTGNEKPLFDRGMENMRLSDFAAYRPSSSTLPGPQYAALNSGIGNRGIVLNPADRPEERLYREPTQQEQNRELERFHEKVPAPGNIEDIQAIDPEFLNMWRRFFTG